MILGNWDINKQKEEEFLYKLPAMSLFAKISKIPESLLFPRSNHQLSTVYVWLCFQPPEDHILLLLLPATKCIATPST